MTPDPNAARVSSPGSPDPDPGRPKRGDDSPFASQLPLWDLAPIPALIVRRRPHV
jgi:hypothetical protein